MIAFQGETKSINQWAADIGIDHATLRRRLERWPLEKALTTGPLGSTGARVKAYGRERLAQLKASKAKKKADMKKAHDAAKACRYLFPNDDVGNLWLGVLERAFLDLCEPGQEREDAQRWLKGDMDVMQEFGIDPDYIRLVVKQAGLEL